MAQGKFKPSGKAPDTRNTNKKKGKSFTRRSNAPIQPKKNKIMESQKIKQIISKSINRSMEDDIRQVAVEKSLKLSKAQEAVIKENKRLANVASSSASTAGTSS